MPHIPRHRFDDSPSMDKYLTSPSRVQHLVSLSLPWASSAGASTCLDAAPLVFPVQSSQRCLRLLASLPYTATSSADLCSSGTVFDATALLDGDGSVYDNTLIRFAELR